MKKKLTITEMILVILTAAQFIAIICFNYIKAYGFLGMDSALALRHGIEMWKNGIFLENFSYFSSLETDCVGFFAMPIYMLTGNLGLAMALCHAVAYFCMVWILYDIAKNVNASLTQFLMMVLFVFTPYTVGGLDWTSMLYISVAQYGFRVMVLLMMFDLMLICDQEKIKKTKLIILLVLFSALNFWTSMSTGNYVLCMIVLPITIGYVLSCIQQEKFKLFSWSNLVIVLSFLVSFVGYRIRVSYAGVSHRNDMQVLTDSDFIDNMEIAIGGILRLFGGIASNGGISIFSEAGIDILLKFVLIVFCGIAVTRLLCKDKVRSNISVYFFAVFLVDFGILLLTDTRYEMDTFEHRYHILWGAMFLIVAAYALFGMLSWGKKVMNRIVSAAIIFAIVLINVFGFRAMNDVDRVNGDSGYEKTIISTAEKEGVNSIFVYQSAHTAAVIRAIDFEKYCARVSYANGTMQMDPYDFYVPYFDNSNSGTSNIMICPSSSFATLPDFVKNAYTLVDDQTFGSGMYVYRAEYSIWDGIAGLPFPGEKISVDFPYTTGYDYEGKINKDGHLVANNRQKGFVLWGPNTAAVPGTYNITLEYRVTKPVEEEGFFDIATDAGQRVVLRQSLPNDATSYTLENVEITGTPVLEFRVYKPAKSVMEIERIVFERIK